MKRYDLTPIQLEYFMSAYSNTPNQVLLDKLALLDINSDVEISIQCIKVNARRFNLKKNMVELHRFALEQKMKVSGKKFHKYSGSPAKEIRRIVPTDCSVIASCSDRDICSLKNACWRYNNKEGIKYGIKINVMYDSEHQIAILEANPISRTSPCTFQSSQAEVLCAPP